MWTILATMVGALVGFALIRNLATLRYRRPDELKLPKPSTGWWLIPALAIVWAWLAWRYHDHAWPVLALWLPLTAALGWLSAVDLDVRRLPDAVIGPTAGWVGVVLTGHAISSGTPTPALTAAATGLTTGLAAWVLHLVSRGGFGFGDIKLVAILSAGLALIAPQFVLPGLAVSCLTAIISALATRHRDIPFGPSLAIGFVLPVCVL